MTIRDLLKATLRHRPDRIIVGEIRGGEAFDLLQFLNTGHRGTLSTVHANSAAQGISRFTSCVLQTGIEIRQYDPELDRFDLYPAYIRRDLDWLETD